MAALLLGGCSPPPAQRGETKIAPSPGPTRASGVPSDAGNSEGCLLFGEGYSFTLSPPKGWVARCGDELPAGRSELALLLPLQREQQAEIAPPLMYVSASVIRPGQTLEGAIAAENDRIAMVASASPHTAPTVTPHAALRLGDGTPAPVWRYEQPATQRFEITAFAAQGSVLLFISALGGSPEAVTALEGDFTKLVAGIHPISTNVTIRP